MTIISYIHRRQVLFFTNRGIGGNAYNGSSKQVRHDVTSLTFCPSNRNTYHSHLATPPASILPQTPSTRESPQTPSAHFQTNHQYFSSLRHDYDVDGDDQGPPSKAKPDDLLLPTKHSRYLPPPVCPPTQLRSEVEFIFAAPVGSLIVYQQSTTNASSLKSVEEEMEDAYYASDEIVQRVEYILRGLNAVISDESHVSRGLKAGAMSYWIDDDDAHLDEALGDGMNKGTAMTKKDSFNAMRDIISRMEVEGDAYEELRTRVRSQIMSPGSGEGANNQDKGEDGNDDDNDDEEEALNKWTDDFEESMKRAGLTKSESEGNGDPPSAASEKNGSEDDAMISPEKYQFGASPGVTTHMYDLLLDSLACLCRQYYSADQSSSSFRDLQKQGGALDMVEIMGDDSQSPPALAKEVLETVLHRHMLDGGDIGLASENIFGVGKGIGTGTGTGAGALANVDPNRFSFDVRTCPTPMTFNGVIRVAAEFDPEAYAKEKENAEILRGNSDSGDIADQLKQDQERLRDITVDAAFSTYSRMNNCAAITLHSMRSSQKNATSRSSVKKLANLLALGSNENYKSSNNSIVSGRNSATYAYLLQTVAKCIPPSLSRGNIAFGLYHKACVQEGVMDAQLLKAMRSVGGYEPVNDDIDGGSGASSSSLIPPPVTNGPLFDSFIQKELGNGITMALNKGRKLGQDRNFKLRRHIQWDGAY